MTCPDCGAELVATTMPTRMRWTGTGWACEAEQTFWVHRAGTTCGEGS